MEVDGFVGALFPVHFLLLLLPRLPLIMMATDIKPWDGCLSSTSLDSKHCFSVSAPMYGDDAWRHCESFDFRNSSHIYNKVWRKISGHKLSQVWSGPRETFLGSKQFVTYSKEIVNFTSEIKFTVSLRSKTERCVSVENVSFHKQDLYWTPCRNGKMPIVCKQQKFTAKAYNASDSIACNHTEAISLSLYPGCFVPGSNGSFTVRLKPTSTVHDVRNINMNTPIEVSIEEYRNGSTIYRRDGASMEGTTEFYHFKMNSLDHKVRLELRRNKTAGGLFLWVQHDRRTDWPPTCVGATVNVIDVHLRTLRVVRNPSTLTDKLSEQMWCFTKDIVTGKLVDSNRLMMEQLNDSCNSAESGKGSNEGPPDGTIVDERASCLRCIKIAFSPCGNETCPESCSDYERCRLFGLTSHQMSTGDKTDTIKTNNCSLDERCAADFTWNYTNTVGDCNGDGESDCDDRFSQLTSSCETEQFNWQREKYWNCRNDPETEFVDVLEPDEKNTVRYYCSKIRSKEDNKRHWSSAYKMDRISPYANLSTHKTTAEEPILTQIPSDSLDPETEKKIINIVQNLQMIDKPLAIPEAMEMVNNVSEVLSLHGNALSKIQDDTVVPSLPDLVEGVMIQVPNNFNMSTKNLAVTKSLNMGTLLTSELPTSGTTTFGSNPNHSAVHTIDDILGREEEIEAAVLLSGPVPDDMELLIVTFSDGADFVSSIKKHENNSTDLNTTKSVGDVLLDGKGSACINSHVLSASVLHSNRTKAKLPSDYLDLFFRTKSPIRLGQEKHCVYLDEENGVWKSDGCALLRNTDDARGVDMCRCNHLTHFAQVVTDGELFSNSLHAYLLHWFTVASCFISLLGLTGVLATGVLLGRWRKKKENKVLMNLSAAVFLFMALLLWQCFKPRPPIGKRCVEPETSIECRATGAILHFLVLASFCWMLAAAITHYMRLATLTGPKSVSHFQLKIALLGWCTPLLPVIVLLCVDSEAYSPRGRDFCYPHGLYFYLTVFMPIVVVLLLNCVAFVFIMRQLFPKLFSCFIVKSATNLRVTASERRIFLRKVLVSIIFTFLFGITWILGLVAYTPVMIYLLCVAVALQGPLLFIFFVLGEESVRSKIRSMRSTKDSQRALLNSKIRSELSGTCSTSSSKCRREQTTSSC